MISSANELPSSWVRRLRPGVRDEVVHAVAVLQVRQLLLEDVVERRAEQAAEQVLLLGQAADPEVDVVEPGVDLPSALFAHAPALFTKS